MARMSNAEKSRFIEESARAMRVGLEGLGWRERQEVEGQPSVYLYADRILDGVEVVITVRIADHPQISTKYLIPDINVYLGGPSVEDILRSIAGARVTDDTDGETGLPVLAYAP